MEMKFRSSLSKLNINLDIDPEKCFIEIFDDIAKSSHELDIIDDSRLLLPLLTNPSVHPMIFNNEINIFDFWKTPNELGVSDGSEVLLGLKFRAGAGILPLNALFNHYDEITSYLEQTHKGIQCAMLFTKADDTFQTFINKYLYSEIIDLSRNIIVYAPIDNLYLDNDHQFHEWWENEYSSETLDNAWNNIHHNLLCLPNLNVYKLCENLGISEDNLPCLIFFKGDLSKNLVVQISDLTSDIKIINSLRKIFSYANQVNLPENQNAIKDLKKKIRKFEKKNKTGVSNFPITLINISIVDITGLGLINSLFNGIG